MCEGSERCEEGEDGGKGSGVAPGEIVVVGIQEIVAAPAIYGENLRNILYNFEYLVHFAVYITVTETDMNTAQRRFRIINNLISRLSNLT